MYTNILTSSFQFPQNILLANIGELDDLDDYLDEQTTNETQTTEKQSKPKVTFKDAEDDDPKTENEAAALIIENEATGDAEPPLSPDGKYVVLLDNTDQSDGAPVKSADLAQPIDEHEEEPESEA